MTPRRPCPACDGCGQMTGGYPGEETFPVECSACLGTGVVLTEAELDAILYGVRDDGDSPE